MPDGCLDQAVVKRSSSYHAPESASSRSAFSFARGGIMPAPKPQTKAQHVPDAFSPGARVEHPKFGPGSVLSVNGEGDEKIAVIRFDTAGEKKMFVAFAPLKIL